MWRAVSRSAAAWRRPELMKGMRSAGEMADEVAPRRGGGHRHRGAAAQLSRHPTSPRPHWWRPPPTRSPGCGSNLVREARASTRLDGETRTLPGTSQVGPASDIPEKGIPRITPLTGPITEAQWRRINDTFAELGVTGARPERGAAQGAHRAGRRAHHAGGRDLLLGRRRAGAGQPHPRGGRRGARRDTVGRRPVG